MASSQKLKSSVEHNDVYRRDRAVSKVSVFSQRLHFILVYGGQDNCGKYLAVRKMLKFE